MNLKVNNQTMKIFPTEQELSRVENVVRCSEKDCQSVFKCASNLRMHLIKHHKMGCQLTDYSSKAEYYCPIKRCKYNIKSSNYFSKMKYLKQHYLKCHASKDYACSKCPKKFSTKSACLHHLKDCGKLFVCSCGWKYNNQEALLIHCKRKGHSAKDPQVITRKKYNVKETSSLPKSKKSPVVAKDVLPTESFETVIKENNFIHNDDIEKQDGTDESRVVKLCIASPPHSKSPRKPTNDFTVFPTHYIAAIALSELSTTFIFPKNCHIGVQTVDAKLTKKNRSINSDKNRKNSQETQTACLSNKIKNKKICAETQTSSHVKRKMAVKPLNRMKKISSETQTKNQVPLKSSVESISVAMNLFSESSLSNSNESSDRLIIDEDTAWGEQSYSRKLPSQSKPFISAVNSNVFNINPEHSMQSSKGEFPLSTLGSIDINKLCNNETQTEMDCLFHNEEGTSTTETQTTDELMGDLLYSNTCTQTCDDVDEFFDFNFVDIETQTAWPDL